MLRSAWVNYPAPLMLAGLGGLWRAVAGYSGLQALGSVH